MKQKDIAMQSFFRWIEKVAANANTQELDTLELNSLVKNFNALIGTRETILTQIDVPASGLILDDRTTDSVLLNVPVTTVEGVMTVPPITKTTDLKGQLQIRIKFVPDETTPTFIISDALTLWLGIQTSLFGAPLQLSFSNFMMLDYLTSIKTQAWSPLAAFEVKYDFTTLLHSVEFLGVVYPSVQIPIIPVPTVTEKTDTTAKIAGSYTYTGLQTITEVGIILGQTGEADIEVPASAVSSSFTVDLTNLEDDVVYAISTYVKFATGSYTSDFGFFSAKDIPNVTTAAAASITRDSVTAGGSYVYDPADGVGAITEVGVDWKISGGAFAEEAAGAVASPFTVPLSALANDSSYVLKAYVKVGATKYSGAEVTFSTKEIPVVTTAAASAITGTTATVGGSYVYDPANGVGAISEVGIEWKIDGGVYAAIAGATVETPNTIALTELTLNSLYHVKSYVKIGAEKFYGSEVNFNTLAE